MEGARIWEEQVVIPTYEIGEADKNPIFLDKRVYQAAQAKSIPTPRWRRSAMSRRTRFTRRFFWKMNTSG